MEKNPTDNGRVLLLIGGLIDGEVSIIGYVNKKLLACICNGFVKGHPALRGTMVIRSIVQ
jgi:hypothetical protein